jgi:hypothetical protein
LASVGGGPAVAESDDVRSLAFLVAMAIVAAWARFGRLATTTANTEAAVNQPISRMQEVRSVALDGRRVPDARLRALLETRPGEQLNRARLERDRDMMVRELAAMGYLAAKVEPAVITFDAVGAAYVTFDIDQGKLFHLRTVEVTGPGRDLVVVTLGAGDDAIRARIDGARQALADGLARRGKPAAVELSVRTDLAAAAVDVVLTTR